MKKNRGQGQEKPQSMHRVLAKFTEYASSYFADSTTQDPNSTISKVITASREGQEIPKNIVLKGIEKLEDCRDQELFYAAKDGEYDAKPSSIDCSNDRAAEAVFDSDSINTNL